MKTKKQLGSRARTLLKQRHDKSWRCDEVNCGTETRKHTGLNRRSGSCYRACPDPFLHRTPSPVVRMLCSPWCRVGLLPHGEVHALLSGREARLLLLSCLGPEQSRCQRDVFGVGGERVLNPSWRPRDHRDQHVSGEQGMSHGGQPRAHRGPKGSLKRLRTVQRPDNWGSELVLTPSP